MTTEKRSCNNCNAPRKDAIAILFRCAGCKVTYDERFATKWQPIKGGASLGQKHGGKRVPNKFTPGRLKMQHPHEGERGWEIAFEPGLQQVCQNVTEANARRLVACWNACDGLRTESLERMGTLDRATIAHEVELQSRIKQAEFQRDELLEVLKRLESANEHRAHLMSGDNYIQQLRIRRMGDALTEIDLARHAARAAIAKAEGGAA